MKNKLLLSLCLLGVAAAVPFAWGATQALAEDAAQATAAANFIRHSEEKTVIPSNHSVSWTYGAESIIAYTFRPEHGDTALYTLSVDGEEKHSFAVKYGGAGTAGLYAVENGEVTSNEFEYNSLDAYFRTLAAGSYSLNITVPRGEADAGHTHWYDDQACDITAYEEASLDVTLTVTAYDIVNNVGNGKPITYTIDEATVPYNGKADNVPGVTLTFTDNAGNTVTLVEGVDYELASENVEVGTADLTIIGKGGFTGSVTISGAYEIVKADTTVSDVYVARWRYGEYDREVNLFSANVNVVGDIYFTISKSVDPDDIIDGLEQITLNDGMVSTEVEGYLNELDAGRYCLFATVVGDNTNYNYASAYTWFDIGVVTNTWKTVPNVVSWEWYSFDKDINVISAAPVFGDSVTISIYTKDGENYTALKFDGEESFTISTKEEYKLPDSVITVLSNLNAGTYYLSASVESDSNNYTSINDETYVPFRVLQARNYWTQLPKISNWAYGSYNPEINVISATAAYGTDGIRFRIYKQGTDGVDLIRFGDTTSFSVGNSGKIPAIVEAGLKALGAGKYYLRAEVAGTTNYTALQDAIADFTQLPSFEVIKAENYWTTAPDINAWAEGQYSNANNIPSAVSHYGSVKIVIVDVNDETNVVYDTENQINKLADVGVGAYLLTATVEGTDNYAGLTFDKIFQVFVPETENVGIAWWLVLIIVVCSLGVLVFIFWLLHDNGVLQMLTSKTIVAMRTKATMDATIAAVRTNKLTSEANESAKLAEALEKKEAAVVESESDDSNDDDVAVLVARDESTGMGTFVRYKKSFDVKLIQADDEVKDYYSKLKNLLLSYNKVKSKKSGSYDSFNKGRTQLAKLVIRGKTLCLYLALNPDDYTDSKYKVERSGSKKFAEVPCLIRIKNQKRLGQAVELIAEVCGKLNIPQGEISDVDFRPSFESTAELLRKGMIKKIVYTKKLSSDDAKNAITIEQTEELAPENPIDEAEEIPEQDEPVNAMEQETAATENFETTETQEAEGTEEQSEEKE